MTSKTRSHLWLSHGKKVEVYFLAFLSTNWNPFLNSNSTPKAVSNSSRSSPKIFKVSIWLSHCGSKWSRRKIRNTLCPMLVLKKLCSVEKEIMLSYLKLLYESMPSKIQVVAKAKDNHTMYWAHLHDIFCIIFWINWRILISQIYFWAR